MTVMMMISVDDYMTLNIIFSCSAIVIVKIIYHLVILMKMIQMILIKIENIDKQGWFS